jgi:hypothetical protein
VSTPKLEVLLPSGAIDTCEATFEACQRAVGGYVEVVPLRGGDKLLVNEDGALIGLDPNPAASGLAFAGGFYPAVLVGAVVVLPRRLVKKVLGGAS